MDKLEASIQRFLDDPIADMDDRELTNYRGSLDRWQDAVYLFSFDTKCKLRGKLAEVDAEFKKRDELATVPITFSEGQKLRTTAPQRGWNAACCAEPPVGVTCTYECPAPWPGKVQVLVDLRDLGYEPCYEENDNFKSLYFWAATLEEVNG